MTKKQPRKSQHGGARAGAGRPTVFDQKASDSFSMVFTPAGHKVLDRLTRRTKLSRNAIIGTLAIEHGDALTFTEADRFRLKTAAVFAVRVPPAAASKLKAARRRTNRSYSDIGEMLVTRYARLTAFPEAPGA